MDVTTSKRVTAEMKITKPDGTVEVHEVELDEDNKRRFLSMLNPKKEN